MGAVTAAVIAGVAVAGSAVAADQAGKRASSDANRARDQAMAQFQGVSAPEVADQKLDLLLPELVGELNPEMLEAMDLGPSALENLPPEARDAVMASLADSAEIAEGGLRDEDKAAYREIQRQVAGDERARQKDILNRMAQRGVAGSGMELAAKLASSQASADRASQAGDRLSQEAANRALQGISMRAQMAGQVNQMDTTKANARDTIAKYNMMNQQNIKGQNVAARNQAAAQNLQARQAAADAQKQIQNQQQMHNKGLLNQDFQNRMQIANARAGQHQQAAADATARGAREAAMWGNVGSGVASIAGAYGASSGGKKE